MTFSEHSIQLAHECDHLDDALARDTSCDDKLTVGDALMFGLAVGLVLAAEYPRPAAVVLGEVTEAGTNDDIAAMAARIATGHAALHAVRPQEVH